MSNAAGFLLNTESPEPLYCIDEDMSGNARQLLSLITEASAKGVELVAVREAVERNKALHAENSSGTTAEIAEKLGVSKSRVRRMRAEGTLDQEIARLQRN